MLVLRWIEKRGGWTFRVTGCTQTDLGNRDRPDDSDDGNFDHLGKTRRRS